MPNPQYVMVSGASEQLCIIDGKNAKVISTSYLKFKHNVLNITLTKENNLLIILDSKEFLKLKYLRLNNLKILY
ncbi:MAG: hypothetical protein SPLUMA1_SPLUMAMAG1_01901 [uncultured Sulfurimonas sp.]|nr:MAG: hypothetical protein SPLUMA1_SPLUMAMAG1_01901 [uncultured Sulfurimonas sp.]